MFGDPRDVSRAEGATPGVVASVGGGHHVRLLTRVVQNGTPLSDDLLRESVDHDSFRYLDCYKKSFAGTKAPPGGVVTVGFEVADQLPQHAAMRSSDFSTPAIGACLADTVRGQSINDMAAMPGAGGARGGPVTYAFRFVLVD
jgi:hypothetical protein